MPNKATISFSEIARLARGEIIYFVNCEIWCCASSEIKFVPSYAAGISHICEANISHRRYFTRSVGTNFTEKTSILCKKYLCISMTLWYYIASVLLNQSTSEISRRCGMWNVCLAANVKYCSFVAMWNEICPRSRSEHFTRVIAFHTPQAYFTCPQGQISLKKALAVNRSAE